MIINLLNEYFVNRAADNNDARIVNWYLEVENASVLKEYQTGGLQQQKGKYKVVALPTPGFTLFSATGGSIVRAAITNRDIAYFVVDNNFGYVDSLGNWNILGQISSSTGYIEIVSIGNAIQILDTQGMYNYNVNTSIFTNVTTAYTTATGALPQTMSASNGFIISSPVNSISVYGSNISDGTTWSALSFANKQGADNYVTKLITNQGYVWVIGDKSCEVWYDSGQSIFAFAAYENLLFEYGTPAPASIAKGNNNIYGLMENTSGGYTIIETVGFSMSPISNDAIGYQLSQMSTVADAFGYCYQIDSHEFYLLTFPTGGKTFVFDIKNRLWHEQQGYFNSQWQQQITSCHCACYGYSLVGDSNSGNIYKLDINNYTQNNTPIQRLLQSPTAYNEGKKFFVDKLQIDTETAIGSNLTMNLNISYDSGHTYTNQLTGTIPQAGGRMQFRRLGYTQNGMTIQLITTANGNIAILGACAEIRQGIN